MVRRTAARTGGIVAVIALLFALFAIDQSSPATAQSAVPTPSHYVLVGNDPLTGVVTGSGMASDPDKDSLVYSSTLTLPQWMIDAGYTVGDPDSFYVPTPHPQDAPDPIVFPIRKIGANTAIIGLLPSPAISQIEAAYEEMWAQDVTAMAGYHAGAATLATTLGGQWMVSAGPDATTGMAILPTPMVNPAAPAPGTPDAPAPLLITGHIALDAVVTGVEGCDFVSDTVLVCATNDPVDENGLLRKSVLEIDLPHALDGGEITGHVQELFAVPLQSECAVDTAAGADFAVGGVDYDAATAELRVAVYEPGDCADQETVYVYAQTPEPAVTPVVATPVFTG